MDTMGGMVAGKVIIITGAAGNLGAATAASAREGGARVALVDLSADRLKDRFPGGAGDPDMLLVGGINLTEEDGANAMVAATRERFGRVDALFNIAGGFAFAPVAEDSFATYDRMQMINLKTVFHACKAAIPAFRAGGGGRIVNIGAGAALNAPAGLAAYTAAKSGVMRLTEALAQELKGDGVTVNAILPSIIDTPENRAAMPDADFSAWVPAADVAAVMLFLASEQARSVTGALIPINGTGG